MTAPILTGFAPSITLDENTVNGTPQLLDSDVTFSDAEGNFNGGRLTLSGLRDEDRVSVRNQGTDAGQISVSGNDVLFGGVVIGTLSGGSGATLTIDFNASATSAAIEALIENLTYANVSDNPTASRNLSLQVTDAAGEYFGGVGGQATFVQQTGAANPFQSLSFSSQLNSTFYDFDGDGDQDMLTADGNGYVRAFANEGGVFTERTGQQNPYNGLHLSYWADVATADIDGDGDIDLVGSGYGNGYQLRTFSANGAGSFSTTSVSGLSNVGVNYAAAPTFADLDGDGDMDLIVSNGGYSYGQMRFFRNEGNGTFAEQGGSNNPLNAVNFGSTPALAFADLDGDGDLDAVAGQNNGTLKTFRNDGAGSWSELTGSANPFGSISTGYSRANPTFADVDGDGDQDLIVGSDNGRFVYVLNTTPHGERITVNVTGQNDAIVHTGLPTDVTVLEDTASSLDLSSVSISDPDVVGNITVVLSADSGTMTATSSSGVTVSGSATGALTLVGTAASIDAWLNVAGNVRYTSALDLNGDNAAILTVTANDGSGVVTVGTVNIDITNTTEAPVLTGLASSVTFAENTVNGTPQLIDADVTFSDFEGTFDGGRLMMSGLLAADRVSVRNEGVDAGQIGLSGTDVTYGGVVIGTLSGGSGTTLTIIFNAAADAAAVDALIQNLTYATVSDNPTASHNLSLNVTDADGQSLSGGSAAGFVGFAEATGAANPFAGLSGGGRTTPSFGDVDGDGDMDMVVTAWNSGRNVQYLENVGGVFTARTGASNPFNGVSGNDYEDPTLVDLDGDGDLDLVVHQRYSNSRSFFNTNGVFTERTGAQNPLNGFSGNYRASPSFVDMDGDGDQDYVLSNGNTLRYFSNTNGVFAEQTGAANPFNGYSFGGQISSAFADLDGDGDMDLVVGQSSGPLRTYRNNGGSWTELTGTNNPFNGIAANAAAPTFADVDGDGDLDLMVGTDGGVVRTYLNTAPRGQTITINVTPENDALVHTGLPTDVTVVEEIASNLDLSALSLSNPDGTESITVTLTADTGTMRATSGGGVTVTGSATGVLVLTGSAAAIDAWLNTPANVQYTGGLNVSGDDAATITVTANDGTDVVTIGTVNLDITNTIEAPVLTDFAPSVTFAENTINTTPQLIDADVQFSDFEDTFDGGSLILSGLLAEDRVSVRNEGADAGQIGLSGANVTYGGVVIGTLSGGSGSTLSISFNAAANSEAIDALVQNLTYANVSNNPTATRNLALNIIDADGMGLGGTGTAGAATFSQLTGTASPFSAFGFGSAVNSDFFDFDGDGDADMITADNNGSVRAFRNDSGAFTEVSGGANPFNGYNFGGNSYTDFAFTDIDGDGDIDAVANIQTYINNGGGYWGGYGTWTPQLRTFTNNGNGTFSERTGGSNPFNGLSSHYRAAPVFADLDGDGDEDLVVNNGSGFRYFRNNGNGTFAEQGGSNNPLNGVAGYVAAPAFADLDGDGDLDMVVGSNSGNLRTYLNNGVAGWSELTGAANPFNGVQISNSRGNPSFADVDSDGDLDLVVGSDNGRLQYFLNTTPRGQVITVNVTPEHDAVTATGVPADVVAIEDAPSNLDLSGIALTDPDVTGNITVVLTASTGTMVAASSGGVTVTGSATGVLTLTGTAAAIDAWLNNAAAVSYTGPANANGNDAADIVITADGGAGAVTVGTVHVDITAVNDAPTLSGLAGVVNFIESDVNGGPRLLDADVAFLDLEDNLNGGVVTLSGLLAEDQVSVRNQGTGAGQIGLSGTDVTYGGVVIGTMAGGAGSTLTITLNAAATSAGVDALIQNLTYANTSDNPTSSRTLSLNVSDSAGLSLTGANQPATFAQLTGASNPFNGANVNMTNTTSVVDLDRDGDMDLVSGDSSGRLNYFLNTGGSLVQQTGAANPFNTITVGNWADPAFADLDGDGDLDLVVGGSNGTLRTFRNDAGAFNELTGAANPFNGFTTGYRSAPTFADIDGDGDLDLVVNGSNGGSTFYLQNTTPRASNTSFVVNIAGQNDAPRATGLPTDISVQGETASNLDLSSMTLTDVDTVGPITVRLTAGAGLLAGTSADGVTVSGSGTGVLVLTGAAAAIDAFLNIASSVQYTGALELSGDNATTITVTADDGTGVVTLGVVNLDIASMDDVVEGDAGANTLQGRSGNDVLRGHGGNDILDGGTGIDTADYSGAAGGTFVALNGNLTRNDGDGGQDTLISIENVIGSAFDDTLIGNGLNNILNGGTGRDTLLGLAGDDTLAGGLGAPNTMQGGVGDDTYVTDVVGDTLVELANEGNDTVRTSRSSFTLATNFENLVHTGSANFRGVGNGVANRLTGGSGNDVLIGMGGADTLNGGAGVDLADYSGAAGGVNADLSTGVVSDDGDGSSDTVTAIENLLGSAFNDILTGDAGVNVLTGGAGDDLLSGGAGADTLNGGAGIDTASWANAAAGVRAAINSAVLGTGQAGADGSGAVDQLIGIENLTGSAFDDVLVGSAAGNILSGGLGADLLMGMDGNDTLIGGSGAANTLQGGLGDDTYVVSANDTIVEMAGEGRDTVSTDRANFVLGANLEDLTFIGSGNFGGTGNALANVLTGGVGHDTLTGRGGNDSLNGGAGFDTADFTGARGDYLIENLGNGRFRVTDSVGGRDGVDLLEGMEQVRFSGGLIVSLSTIPVASVVATDKSAMTAQTLPGLVQSDEQTPLVLPAADADKFLVSHDDFGPQVQPGLVDDAFIVAGGTDFYVDDSNAPRFVFHSQGDHALTMPEDVSLDLGSMHDGWWWQ